MINKLARYLLGATTEKEPGYDRILHRVECNLIALLINTICKVIIAGVIIALVIFMGKIIVNFGPENLECGYGCNYEECNCFPQEYYNSIEYPKYHCVTHGHND